MTLQNKLLFYFFSVYLPLTNCKKSKFYNKGENMVFEIYVQYVYNINEWYSNTRYQVDNGWGGFKTVVQKLPKLETNNCEIPSTLSLKRSVKINYAVNYDTKEKIDGNGSIIGVPLKEWVKLAGFKDEYERFRYPIVVAFGNKIPTVSSLMLACPWQCNNCQYNDCKNGDKNAPALYSNYVRVGVEPLHPEHHICISKNNCEILWPKSHPVNPANELQELRDFFEQPDAVQIYTEQQDRLLKFYIRSCALRTK